MGLAGWTCLRKVFSSLVYAPGSRSFARKFSIGELTIALGASKTSWLSKAFKSKRESNRFWNTGHDNTVSIVKVLKSGPFGGFDTGESIFAGESCSLRVLSFAVDSSLGSDRRNCSIRSSRSMITKLAGSKLSNKRCRVSL